MTKTVECKKVDLDDLKLKKNISKQQIIFYLNSCKHYRYPFFDPTNCYRRDGLFPMLEETLLQIGDKMSQEYGKNFYSINLRGSWLRGIPIRGDDVDVLFIVSDLPQADKINIQEYTRRCLQSKHPMFQMCEGKVELGIKVDPIVFLDLTQIRTIMNSYMYGLGRFLKRQNAGDRDDYQDSFFGSKLTEKKTQFLKSGILIPYVGWIYGRDRKREVFDEIERCLPLPTMPTRLYSEEEISETKETIRQAFIARNLIYPSLEIKKWVDLKTLEVNDLKVEAMFLYRALEPLPEVYSRAVINYIYTLEIEARFLGNVVTPERVEKFAPSYDQLVLDILEMAYLRLAQPPV
jgi:hypothetical protein